MPKRYAGLARVSSREQEREGFSLEVQEEALHRYAEQHDGVIVQLFRIAETASKSEERTTFKALIAYAKAHAHEIDALLFSKVDRAARNLFDYVELERLERDQGVVSIYISQPTENTPAGRMMRRTLANMAAFYTEQQSLDVRSGIARRVQGGMFPNRPPYGYQARRVNGRSIVAIDPIASRKIQHLFELYAYGNHTLDTLIEQLAREGTSYTDATDRFPRSKLHTILRDRAYIGEIMFRGQWHAGSHPPLVDRRTFDRVQELLGEQVYRAHEMLFAGEMIECGHCNHPITGERKTKTTRSGIATYVYYRCARYNGAGHPRTRIKEASLNEQVVAFLDRFRLDDETQAWFRQVLRARRQENQQQSRQHTQELDRQLIMLRQQHDKLLNLHLADRIDESTFANKQAELHKRIGHITAQLSEARSGDGVSKTAEKLFEL